MCCTLRIAGQTAAPIGLKFSVDTKKISTGNAGPFNNIEEKMVKVCETK